MGVTCTTCETKVTPTTHVRETTMTSAAKPRITKQRDIARQMIAEQAAKEAAAAVRVAAHNRAAAQAAAATAAAQKAAAAEEQAKKKAAENAVASIISLVISSKRPVSPWKAGPPPTPLAKAAHTLVS